MSVRETVIPCARVHVSVRVLTSVLVGPGSIANRSINLRLREGAAMRWRQALGVCDDPIFQPGSVTGSVCFVSARTRWNLQITIKSSSVDVDLWINN